MFVHFDLASLFLTYNTFVGVMITYLIKVLFLLLLRGKLYTAFYRQIPASANVIALALECWNIGISAGVALVRASKLLLVTLLHIGRIDIPLLSKESPACGKLLRKAIVC